MELSELKSIWQKTTGADGEGYFVSVEELRTLIKKRSNTAVAQIKRGVRLKAFMAGGIGLLMTLFSFHIFRNEKSVFDFLDSTSNLEVGIFYLVFGLMICFVSVFNAVSYRKILNIEETEPDLKSSIQNILTIIQSAVNVKVYTNTLLLPVTVLAFVVIYLLRGSGTFPTTTVFLMVVAGAMVFAVISYFLTKRDQKQRYGEQISILEDCLEELEEE